MIITVTIDGEPHEAERPFIPAQYVVVPSLKAHCGEEEELRVRGGDYTQHYDMYTCKANCAQCGEHLGEMTVTVSTIFGIEEDRRVLQGRPRVY
tara:strand:- start:6552 stop:6833 length:282 start_codon:yes stop_codon:yes gene_type:complete